MHRGSRSGLSDSRPWNLYLCGVTWELVLGRAAAYDGA